MAYTNFQNCTANEYKNIIYNQETHNKIKVLFNNVELEDADEYCESFEVISRVIPNGSKIFMLENLVSQEATLVLHNINTSIIQDQVSISIGTLVSENTYEYVPIGIYNLQEIPTTDNGKTTIKLRDNSVKLDFNYNAKPLIDEHGGTATKLQILQDICSQANITCNVSSFIGSSDLIGIYDNTITGRQYVAYLAGSAGAIPIITRSGALDFKYLNNLSTIEIPIEIVEQYSNAENFKISRVVYEDAIRKYESGNENYDTLFLDSANPYISSQEQVASIYNIVNNFEINSFKTGRILGNPAIDSYDLIQITDYDGTIFKTFANNTLRYNGKMINTFASEISFERKKENVSLKSGATFKKWAKTEIDNANAQITIQAGQIEEIEQDLQNPTSTKEGEYFGLEDALDEPLVDFKMYGDTQQDSTTGKNICSNITKPANANLKFFVSKKIAQTFTISFTTNEALNGNSLYLEVDGTSYGNIGGITASANTRVTKTYTLSNENYQAIQNGTTIDLLLYKNGANFTIPTDAMVENGSSATSWEPYTNGPAPNPTYPFDIHNVSGDNTINICGKNLFDKDNPRIVNKLPSDGGTITTGSKYVSSYLSAKEGDIFTLSSQSNLLDTYASIYFVSEELSTATTWLARTQRSGGATSITATAPQNTKYVCFYMIYSNNQTTINSLLETIQIEKSSTATEYEAYQGNSQLISLGDIELNKISTYQDYIYKDNDRWFLHKEIGKVVLNGSEESWRRVDVYKGISQFEVLANDVLYANDGVLRTLSNFFKGIPYNNSWSYDNSITSVYTSRLRVMTRMYSSADDFKKWLSTHNLEVYYVLATPTNTEITDTTLIGQLNNLMTLPLYKNMTHITIEPNDLTPIMNIEYVRDTAINSQFVRQPQLNNYYTKTETTAQIQIGNASIQQSVVEVQTTLNNNNEAINTISNQVQNIQTSTSQQINIINEQLENGVEKVKTRTGFTFDDNGLSITKGEQFKNLNTDRNVQIISNGKEISFMGYDDNLKKTVARVPELESERATIGVHRTEVITRNGKKRTAGFYIGGGN